jgi:hypothetical protein
LEVELSRDNLPGTLQNTSVGADTPLRTMSLETSPRGFMPAKPTIHKVRPIRKSNHYYFKKYSSSEVIIVQKELVENGMVQRIGVDLDYL